MQALGPRPNNHGHSHDYDIRGPGAVRLLHRETERSVGDLSRSVFFVPAGRSHTEEIGAPGARIVVGEEVSVKRGTSLRGKEYDRERVLLAPAIALVSVEPV